MRNHRFFHRLLIYGLVGGFFWLGFGVPGSLAQTSGSVHTLSLPVPRDSVQSDTLYFGTRLKGGKEVSTVQWEGFLRDVVTPRFPDGLTVWDAQGQWRGSSGKTEGEKTKVLLLIHPSSPKADKAIAEIIRFYKEKFGQESVMWVRSPAKVRF